MTRWHKNAVQQKFKAGCGSALRCKAEHDVATEKISLAQTAQGSDSRHGTGGRVSQLWCLRAQSGGASRLSARQIEASRRAITRHMKRAGRLWIRVFPDVPVSKKPIEVRMGCGKGSVEWWAVRVRPGRILF